MKLKIMSALNLSLKASPPVRRRGLKLPDQCLNIGGSGSPPVRRRGLKPWHGPDPARPGDVASRAEAWIETDMEALAAAVAAVASRAEAWIETPSQIQRYFSGSVASRAEAWIET